METLVGQVRDVENHPDFVHHLQQLAPLRRERSGAAGAEGVGARPVVHRADHPQPVVPPEPRLLRIDDGVVSIDGKPLEEPYTDATADHRDFPSTLVPPGHVFVLGDNRQDSDDSRFDLGTVPLCQVVGAVVWLARRTARVGGAGAEGLEPPTTGFGDRDSTN